MEDDVRRPVPAAGGDPATDWHEWHTAYDDPESSLSRRLLAVRRLLDQALGQRTDGSVLSLCAGDGRDVIPVLDVDGRRALRATLVEADAALCAAAERRAADAGVAATVVTGDAGATATWASVPPVDVLLLCGVFGNVSPADVRRTVRCTPQLLAPGGHVLWTRGGRPEDDQRPQVRAWFADAGLVEVAFEAETAGYGVGLHRLVSAPPPAQAPLPTRLFTFLR